MLLTTAHYNDDDDQVTGCISLSTMKYEVILTLSLASSYLAKGKETDQQVIEIAKFCLIKMKVAMIEKQEINVSVLHIRNTMNGS